MSAKKSYNRFFIIFQEEDKGYGVGPDRPPTGYVKVETKGDKGKVTVYVQNLKPFEDGECLYKCYLISHQDNKDDVVYLGIMNIDELGRGESSWESAADNAFDSKISVDKFNAAAIVVEGDKVNSLMAPLAGYMSKEKFEWRSKMPVKHHHAEVVVKKEQVSEEAEKFELYESEVEKIAAKAKEAEVKAEVETEVKVEAEVEVEIEAEVSRKPDESSVESVETASVDNSSAEEEFHRRHHKHNKECGESSKDKPKHKHYPYENYGYPGYGNHDFRKMLKKLLEDILEDYEEVDMQKWLKNCRMWKVDMNKYAKDMSKIYKYPCYDLVFYLMMNNPYCNYNEYIKKHGHYLFGVVYEDDDDRQAGRAIRRLVFGIPGNNAIIDQPFQGVTGFTTWLPAKNDSSDGYWVMAYDPMTGLVTMPNE